MHNMTHICFTLVYSWSVDGNAEFFIKYKWNRNNICVMWIVDIIIFCMWSHWLSIATKSFASSTSHGNVAADLLLSNVPTVTTVTTLGKYSHYLFYRIFQIEGYSLRHWRFYKAQIFERSVFIRIILLRIIHCLKN